METTYTVAGMSCEHCENRVARELMDIGSVKTATASFSAGTVLVESTGALDLELVREAIEEAGYELVAH